jgi:hypothetical protein
MTSNNCCSKASLPWRVGLSKHDEDCPRRADRPNTEDFIKLGQKLRHERILPTCLTCLYWDHVLEVCRLYKQRPPAQIIVDGCVSWTEDQMPF